MTAQPEVTNNLSSEVANTDTVTVAEVQRPSSTTTTVTASAKVSPKTHKNPAFDIFNKPADTGTGSVSPNVTGTAKAKVPGKINNAAFLKFNSGAGASSKSSGSLSPAGTASLNPAGASAKSVTTQPAESKPKASADTAPEVQDMSPPGKHDDLLFNHESDYQFAPKARPFGPGVGVGGGTVSAAVRASKTGTTSLSRTSGSNNSDATTVPGPQGVVTGSNSVTAGVGGALAAVRSSQQQI